MEWVADTARRLTRRVRPQNAAGWDKAQLLALGVAVLVAMAACGPVSDDDSESLGDRPAELLVVAGGGSVVGEVGILNGQPTLMETRTFAVVGPIRSLSWGPQARAVALTISLGERTGDRFVYEATDVWRSTMAAAPPRRLTYDEDASSPVFTLDGTAVVVTRTTPPERRTGDGLPVAEGEMWLVPLTASRARVLLAPADRAIDRAGSFSPDGRELAFSRCHAPPLPLRYPLSTTCDVYIMSSDGSHTRRIMSRARDPDWAPDGKTIVVSSDRDETGIVAIGEATEYSTDLYLIDVVSGQIRRLTHTPQVSEASPRYSPDGGRLAFTERRSGEVITRVVVSNSDGTCRQSISGAAEWTDSPSWRQEVSAAAKPLVC